jgi:short subunit dehydrogenase-like uncharacterized protein
MLVASGTMAGRIVLFGATGYTGAMVAERLAAEGERPVLAGRSPERLSALAERLGGLEWRRADAVRRNSVFALVEPGDVLLSTVGPFAKHGDAAVRAAIAAGAVYVDSTGEPAFIRRVFGALDGPAARGGAALLTAMGYDYVPGALAGALALEAAGAAAVRVDVGYYSLDAARPALSAGTRESLVGASLSDGHAYRDGVVRAVRPAERVRTFAVAGRARPAVSIGGAEHFTLPAAYARVREVNVYLGGLGPLARLVQAGALLGASVQRLPGVRGALRLAGERLAALAPAPAAGTTPGGRSWIAAEALDAGGERLAEVHLTGADGYEFTARFLAWACRRLARHGRPRAGALGPVEAFGLRELEAGVRAAGLAVAPPAP